jgi:hypothetical protein
MGERHSGDGRRRQSEALPWGPGARSNNLQVPSFLSQDGASDMMIDPKAKLLTVLDAAEEYRSLAMRAKDRGEHEAYERIVELYVEIAEELEALMDE